VDTVPEGDVTSAPARHVEYIGVVEYVRIAVRGADEDNHDRAGRDTLSPDFDLRCHETPEQLDRTVITEQLFNRLSNAGRIALQQLNLVRVLQEGQHPIANQIGRGFISRHEQKDTGIEKFRFA
jgi:hypothetical protein